MNLTPQEMPINTRNQMLLTTNTFLSHVEDRVCRAELSLTVCHSSHCDERSAASVLHFCHSRFKQQFSSTIQDIKVKRNCQFRVKYCVHPPSSAAGSSSSLLISASSCPNRGLMEINRCYRQRWKKKKTTNN